LDTRGEELRGIGSSVRGKGNQKRGRADSHGLLTGKKRLLHFGEKDKLSGRSAGSSAAVIKGGSKKLNTIQKIVKTTKLGKRAKGSAPRKRRPRREAKLRRGRRSFRGEKNRWGSGKKLEIKKKGRKTRSREVTEIGKTGEGQNGKKCSSF